MRPCAEEMSGIVIAERSATLSHLLQRTLSASKLSADRMLDKYSDAKPLLMEGMSNGPVRLLLLGAPQRIGPDFEGLLELLLDERFADLPVLVLTHERNQRLNDWLSKRRQSSLLLWANFSRIPPLVRQHLPEELPGSVTSAKSSKHQFKLKLLFVDDSQSVRFAYKKMLVSHGFDVDLAGSLSEAFQKAQDGVYDLAIIDYYLPDGNGDELCRKLIANPRTSSLPIAMITGTYKDAVIKRCLDAGAVECMFKNEVLELTLARIKALARSVEVQKSVEADRQRLDGILASVGDGVYGVDPDGTISFANPRTLELLGYVDAEELLGKRAHSLFHFAMGDGSRVEEADTPLGRAYAEGDPLSGHETVFWSRVGEALPVECSVVPLNIGGKRDGTVVVFRDISDRKSADQMRWEMMHDGLTGAANKRSFNQALAHELTQRTEHGGYSALLLIDLDRFSMIEEQAGRPLADRLLADVVARLKERLRQNDVLARLEEDHFALMLSGVQLDNLISLADAAREQIRQITFQMYGKTQQLSATVGVGVISSDTPSAEYVLEQSRIACQTAKRRGGNQTQIHVAQADQRIARELDAGWTTKLKEALHEDRFLLLTQPIVRAQENGNGELLFELLIRMLNRDGEQIAPSVFVPLAERVGMMDKIDLWVLNQALKHLRALSSTPEVCFTINLSNLTVQDSSSLRLMEEQIKASGVDPKRIIFEVTETSEISSLHSARRFIQTLKQLGCRFALDDFGTGFSSISHLKHLPVDFVKLEGSLICDLQESDRDRTMISAITQLAHSLGLQVIAEHVDSPESLKWLKGCGLDFVQGHFLGEPQSMSETDFARARAA